MQVLFIILISFSLFGLYKPTQISLVGNIKRDNVYREYKTTTLQKPTEIKLLPKVFNENVPPAKIISYSIKSNTLGRYISFVITFDRVPDFDSTDRHIRGANEFQISTSTVNTPINQYDVIIRGGEITYAKKIIVRSGFPYNDDGFLGWQSGGWGEITEAVNYSLQDKTISFTVSWDGMHTNTGKFKYHLVSCSYGDCYPSSYIGNI